MFSYVSGHGRIFRVFGSLSCRMFMFLNACVKRFRCWWVLRYVVSSWLLSTRIDMDWAFFSRKCYDKNKLFLGHVPRPFSWFIRQEKAHVMVFQIFRSRKKPHAVGGVLKPFWSALQCSVLKIKTTLKQFYSFGKMLSLLRWRMWYVTVISIDDSKLSLFTTRIWRNCSAWKTLSGEIRKCLFWCSWSTIPFPRSKRHV